VGTRRGGVCSANFIPTRIRFMLVFPGIFILVSVSLAFDRLAGIIVRSNEAAENFIFLFAFRVVRFNLPLRRRGRRNRRRGGVRSIDRRAPAAKVAESEE